MGNWRDSIPSKWLKAAHLEGQPHLMTIKRFSVETVGDDRRPVVWFAEESRGLGLNITNGKQIEKICGSADPAKWTGKRIVLFPTQTEFGGETVDCIRVRAPKPGVKLPEPVAHEPEPEAIDEGYVPTDDDVPF